MVLHNLDDGPTLETLTADGLEVRREGGNAYLKVEENLTTGYQWIFEKKDCHGVNLDISKEFDAPAQFEGEEPLMGEAGTLYVTLTGRESGDCSIRMAYARPWEFDWEDRVQNNM